MASFSKIIRTAVKEQIANVQASELFVINDFDLVETYYPKQSLEDLADRAAVSCVSMAISSSRTRALRNTEKVLLQLPVQVVVQQKVVPSETEAIDKLVELGEQLLDTVESDTLVVDDKYPWMQTDPLKDENGLVYSFEQLTVRGVFHAIYIVTYQHIKQ